MLVAASSFRRRENSCSEIAAIYGLRQFHSVSAQSCSGAETPPSHRVAASALQIEAFLSTFPHRYAQHYPNVQVKLIEAAVSDILPMLERSEIQLGILLQVVLADYRQFGKLFGAAN